MIVFKFCSREKVLEIDKSITEPRLPAGRLIFCEVNISLTAVDQYSADHSSDTQPRSTPSKTNVEKDSLQKYKF